MQHSMGEGNQQDNEELKTNTLPLSTHCTSRGKML